MSSDEDDDDYQVWNNSIIVARQSLLDLPPELWHTHTHTRHQREISRPDGKYLTTKAVGRDRSGFRTVFFFFFFFFLFYSSIPSSPDWIDGEKKR